MTSENCMSITNKDGIFQKCISCARIRWSKYFALQDGGRCFLSVNDGYKRYGESNDCNDDGKGGYLANMVYERTGAVCFIQEICIDSISAILV